MKAKLCRCCKRSFSPRATTQAACSIDCALKLAAEKENKKAEKLLKAQEMAYDQETRERKLRVKTRSEWAKEAQTAFNKWIRLRDAKEGCISCSTKDAGQYHAGHYRTTKAAPELRFSEWNCHKQCAQCNLYESGNIKKYRENLVLKIGEEKVLWLEGPHDRHSWTVDELIQIKKKYNKLCREMEKNARLSQAT